MKLILCGKNLAAIEILEKLTNDEVWAIGVHSDSGLDGWQPSFRAAAERLGVRFDQPRNINDPSWIERLTTFGADALISVQYDIILRRPLLEGIGCPCLNFHFSLLPRHRGVSPIAWAILDGDRFAGVTAHHMTPEIDAGDVVAQRQVPIGSNADARSLYDSVSAATVALFTDCYPFTDDLLGRRLPQDPSKACYHRPRDLDFSRNRINFAQSTDELHRWLRAFIFPPLQLPRMRLGEQFVRVQRVEKGPEPATAAPGTVIAVDHRGHLVATADGTIRLAECIDDSGTRVIAPVGSIFD